MISIPFLLATFLVYAFIPELRNLHGMCLMAYCGGLIVAYTFLAYLKLHSGKIGVAMTGCYIIGKLLTHFLIPLNFPKRKDRLENLLIRIILYYL